MCTINNWDELLDYYKKEISIGKWMFRAEKANCHPLETSLDKAFDNCGVSYKKNEIEQKLIRLFKRRYRLHVDSKMIAQDNLEIVALMQHYGAPTRALDWTYSFFVAVYFAINRHSDKEDGVVWCLDKEWLNKKNETDNDNFEKRFLDNKPYITQHFLEKRLLVNKSDITNQLKYKVKELNYYKDYYPNKFQNLIVNYIINENPELFIYAATPYYLNDRLAIQKGALLFACDITKSWKSNLSEMMEGKSNKVVKNIIIPKEIRKEFLEKLYEMNINQSSLFPGLGGFAESLTTLIAHPGFIEDLR
jgi:hypothetical protein